MTRHLVIAAIGDDQRGVVQKIASSIEDSGCNIESSRMLVMGDAFAQVMMISGMWNNLAKAETALAALEKKLGLTITVRRTEDRTVDGQFMPYSVEVVALDHPGIVSELAQFFTVRSINIQDMVTGTYHAPHTATPMFSTSMLIEVPGDSHIAALREEFLDFCDANNLDGVIEPYKA